MSMKRSPVVSPPSSILIDAVLDGYIAWREENAAVEAAYRSWLAAAREERALAFAAYSAALDREEHAAAEYQLLIERAESHVAASEIRRAVG
ncbi:MAG: hypothetical protein JO262_06655 [Solirubrobacterales bacterium]|nr:hypothetical protein [Solirubrobacterales bacterium]MBV9941794.1 hypothetical protein [Solirubrobacterales bacterium]